jgi:hypothetical protein
MTELMGLEAFEGRNLDVLVEDVPGINSEAIIRRLCKGLATLDNFPIFGE